MPSPDAEYLIEEVHYLKSEIGLADRATETGTVCRSFKLNRQQGKLVMALYRSNGRILSSAHLMDIVDTACDSPRIIGVLVSQIRTKTGMGGMIQSNWGLGYNISPEGMDMVRRILGGAS